jgi:hypothetical protein
MTIGIHEHLSLCLLSHHIRTVLFLLSLHEGMVTRSWSKLKLIAKPCACCSGVAQILLCQRRHDHICCTCTEILLFVRQTFPSVPFLMSCMNRHSI